LKLRENNDLPDYSLSQMSRYKSLKCITRTLRLLHGAADKNYPFAAKFNSVPTKQKKNEIKEDPPLPWRPCSARRAERRSNEGQDQAARGVGSEQDGVTGAAKQDERPFSRRGNCSTVRSKPLVGWSTGPVCSTTVDRTRLIIVSHSSVAVS
jgi:hypothetical protein